MRAASLLCRALLGALLVACLAVDQTRAYKYGDPVPMLKRSQYKGVSRRRHDELQIDSAWFGVMKVVRLNPLTDAKEYLTTDEFKMSFSFSGERLLVPWITITDGKAHYAQAIDFYFQYSQGFVNHVRWQTTYNTDSANKPEHTLFRYHWQEILETDPATGMNFLLIITTVFAWVALVLVLLEYDGRARPTFGGGKLTGAPGRSPTAPTTSANTWAAARDM